MKSPCRFRRRIALTAAGTLLAPAGALASGLTLYEIATPEMDLASAGWAARPQDASTLFKNPAGMNQLEGPNLQTGLQLTYGDIEFSPNADTSARLGTGGGGNAVGALPAMSFFYVQSLGEKWRVGLATLSYFGLAEKYDPDWVGRCYVQESTLIGVSLVPTASYPINDWLSAGAGLNAMYGYLETEVAVNNLSPRLADGQLAVNDRTWGFGANAGVLIRAGENIRVGVNYLSPVKLDIEATPALCLGAACTLLWAGDMTVDQGSEASLRGRVAGAYEDASFTFATLSQNWKL
ncbi:MAG: outer membrane protein transport protein [Verrucomicrobiae bacterium]|nr:outer membrane protein transport protein [Verrucomicrobiae bacterium]